MCDLDLDKIGKLLREKRDQLSEMIETSQEASAPVELDQQVQGRLSRMDALQAQAMAEETLRRCELEFSKTEAALKRLENDDYGYCLSCDELIFEKRLEHDPACVICIACAEKGG